MRAARALSDNPGDDREARRGVPPVDRKPTALLRRGLLPRGGVAEEREATGSEERAKIWAAYRVLPVESPSRVMMVRTLPSPCSVEIILRVLQISIQRMPREQYEEGSIGQPDRGRWRAPKVPSEGGGGQAESIRERVRRGPWRADGAVVRMTPWGMFERLRECGTVPVPRSRRRGGVYQERRVSS